MVSRVSPSTHLLHVQSKGADPGLRTENYDPYLDPGCKTPRGVAIEDEETQDALEALEARYSSVPKVCVTCTCQREALGLVPFLKVICSFQDRCPPQLYSTWLVWQSV